VRPNHRKTLSRNVTFSLEDKIIMALEKTLPILLIFLIGVALKKAGMLRKEDGRMISRLILNVVLPATIINSLSSMVISPSLLLLPLASIAVVVMLLGLGFVLAPILGLQEKTRAAFLISFPTLEVGSIGYAFMVAVYGAGGLALIALFDLGDALFFFLVVPLLASLLGRPAERFRVSDALIQFLKNPVLWAYAVGIVLNCFHIQVSLLSNLFSTLSQALLLLIMLLIASEFELSFSALTFPVLVMYLKMAVGVTLGLLISLLFGLTGVEQVAVVLGSSLPASLMTVVYAREYELDAQFLASTLSLALPTAIAFSFVIMSICR
jgi:predicted permease